MNENRKGLVKLFRLAREQQMSSVLIEFRDRLTRFGYRYVTDYLLLNGVEVSVKENGTNKGLTDEDLNKELVEDPLLPFIHFQENFKAVDQLNSEKSVSVLNK